MTILERGLLSKSLVVKGLVDGLISPPLQRWVYNFDGIDDYGVLDNRAIDVDGDIDVEFMTGDTLPVPGTSWSILSQNISTTLAQREFGLYTNNSNNLQLMVGGVSATNMGQALQINSTYRVTLIGDNLSYFRNGTLVLNTTFNRGAAREPSAQTVIGARSSSASFTGFYRGQIYNLKINGIMWEIRNNGNTIQPSTPAGNNMTLVNMNPDRWSKIPV